MKCKADGWRPYFICSGERADNVPAAPNCRVCTGPECRCPGPGCVQTPTIKLDYWSFFRKYIGKYERAALPDVPTDIATKNVAADCHGFYNEFLIDKKKTEERDWNCALDIENVGELLTSQTGKGRYTATDTLWDQDPLAASEMRKVPPPAPTDIWVPLSGAFSLLQESALRREYDGQLSQVYLDTEHLDDAQHVSTRQLPTRAFAQSATMREFDDSGIGTLVHWWRKQQIAMERLVRRSAVYILLPPQGALGLDLSRPPFTPEVPSAPSDTDPESLPIRVRLDAGEDLLGSVLDAIRFQIEEVPIRLALPNISVTEIAAIKAAWCARIMQETNARNCTENVPPNIQELMQQFDAYEEYMARIPVLRSVLARNVGDVLKLQNEISAPVIDVLRQHLDTYRALLREQATLIGALMPGWRQAETTYKTFHDKINLPFCYNARFSAAVEGLMDGILPARIEDGDLHEKGALIENQLVTLEGLATTQQDIVINLTHVPGIRSRVKLFTFKRFPARINLPEPPNRNVRLTAVNFRLAPPPDLDQIQAAMQEAMDDLPTVDVSHVTPPDVQFPEPLGPQIIGEAQQRLGGINDVLTRMNERYQYYWHSIFAFAGALQYPRPTCQVNGEDVALEPLELCGWNILPGLPEMNLVEMIMRAGSRPMVNLIEDYQSNTWPRHFPVTCLATDPACSLLPGESRPALTEWETFGPENNNTVTTDTLRMRIHDLTLPPPVGSAEPLRLDFDLPDLLPSLAVPNAISLPPQP